MNRCAQLQHDVELYGWDVLWHFAGVVADALLAQYGLDGNDGPDD